MMPAAAALATLCVLLALGGAPVEALQRLAQVTLVALAGGVLWDVLRLLRPAPRRAPDQTGLDQAADRPTIVVDGSNVMHWGGTPSRMVLTRVVAELVARGERPHVYFDANVGYKLADRFIDGPEMAGILQLPTDRVTVVDRGTPADPALLAHAVRARLRVVTNDRFIDWKPQFPQVGSPGFLVKGRWQEGTPMLRL